ncbi:41229_t:CDS:2 [Gigaspora margarita]|uniref:41229_t:CDS:1 n=1 Tax=Gigaspora margarita TaxID=4874 RepID=A0ABN7UG72_GIGMA|nr:41229_t:CDS:2 [Gigaspora margarita]
MQLCGLICIVEERTYPIPLQDVSVEANIVDMIAETTVCQTYKNVEQNSIEAIYKFPFHEAAAICGFEAEIDGKRKVKGIVKEAKQAAKEYDEAIQQGHGAYLLEEELPDIFQCSIGNITAGQMKLNPDIVSYIEKTDYYLKLAVTCRMTSIIQNIESPSHHISTELNIDGNPNVSKITLAEQITHLEKDLILVVKSLGLDRPRAFIEYDSKTETNCIMLTLVPKFTINEIKSELIFVIDRSGSMHGGPVKKASEALQLLLRSLSDDCFFNVISFGSQFDSLFENSQPYSETSFLKALKHAQEMVANYGGTEIYDPLKWAFENSRDDMPTSVFLLTDGEVYNVDQIIELIKSNEEKKRDDLRVFSIGIGDSVSHHLVESVSRAGKGYTQFVTSNERMDKKILGMLKNAIKPPFKDYNITWSKQILEDSLSIETKPVNKPTSSFISFFSNNAKPPPDTQTIFTDMKLQQAPFLIPPIYPGARFIIYCILEKDVEPCKEIILSAISQDGPMKLSIPLDPVALQGTKIHTLAARKLIQDLEEGTSFIHKHPRNKGKNIPDSLIREHIVKLGVTYSLASKYTSFLAVDERGSELVAEAKTFNLQRIVPVTGALGAPVSGALGARVSECCALMPSVSNYDECIEESSEDSDVTDLLIASVKSKPPKIETLYSFLNLQSFDGSFLPSDKFYSWFGKNNFKDFESIGIDDEKVLCLALALAYLEIIMFDTFKEECEMCYVKAKKILKKEVGGDEQKVNENLEKAKEWVKKWTDE